MPTKLIGDNLDMVYGRDGDIVRIGILDLDGTNVIADGERLVVRLAGEYEIVSATVATDGYTTYAACIGQASKGSTLPERYSLGQNYPNPFNPSTSIAFALPELSEVRLDIYNVLGRRVATLVDGALQAGRHTAVWDGRASDGKAVSSGVYFYRLETDAFNQTRKMMMLK